MAVLNGSLEAFALPDVFRLLASNKVTGALKVVRESGDGIIYFRDGEVYYAFSSLTREFLGQRLVNAKLITQGQLLRALDEQKKQDKRLGDLLVEAGYIGEELLDTFLKEQIQDSIFHLLQWDRGVFDFEEGASSPQEVGLSVSVENLIMESSRRIEEWEVIRRKIPSLEVVVRMAPRPPDDSMEINIKPEEWTLLVLADGRRTVRDIAAAAERSEFDACRILYGLVTAGLLDVARGSVAPSDEAPSRMVPPQPPPEAPEAEVPEAPDAEAPEAQARPEPPPEPEPEEAAASTAVVPEPEEVEVRELATESNGKGEPEVLEPEPPAVEEEPEETAPAAGIEEPLAAADQPEVVTVEPESLEPGIEEPEPAGVRAVGAADNDQDSRDPVVSKELLMRLIAGVRNL